MLLFRINIILIILIFCQFPTFSQGFLGKDTLVCSGQYITLNAGSQPVKWSTGEQTSTIRVYQNGTYWAEKDGVRDSVEVTIYDEEYNQGGKWAFGNGTGINFDTLRPAHEATKTDLPVSYDIPAGSSSAVNNDGKLLFFTDGESIYDSSGNVLETGFAGDPAYSQNSLIAPLPGSAVEYYMFTIKDNTLYYSTLKLNPDKSITVTKKNVELGSPVDEKITAVTHGDDKSLWIMTHKKESNVFQAYPLKENGIGTPVNSQTGTVTTVSSGYMKFSPDGSRLALASDFTEVFYFDKNTGRLGVPRYLHVTSSYGLEFSSDGGMLYITSQDKTQTDSAGQVTEGGSLLKVNINYGYQPEVVYRGDPGTKFGALQIGPDDKIYVSQGNNSPNCLGTISNPNDGNATNSYTPNAVCSDNNVGFGLPNFPQHYFTKSKNFSFMADFPCEGDSVNVIATSRIANKPYARFTLLIDYGHPESGDDNFTNLLVSKHLYPVHNDVYRLKATTSDVCRVNTYNAVTFITPQPDITIEDTLLCPGVDMPVYAAPVYPSNVSSEYFWMQNDDTLSITRDFEPATPGDYSIKIAVGGKCIDTDTFSISYKDIPDLNLGDNLNLCEKDSTVLNADIGVANTTYLWSTSETTPTITIRSQGKYYVNVNDGDCLISDTVVVNYFPSPVDPGFKGDTIGCSNKTIVFDAKNSSGFMFLWNNGTSGQTLSTNEPGEYSVEIYNEGCKKTFNTNLTFYPAIKFNLDTEYSLCESEGQSIELDAGPGKNWIWEPDGDVTRVKQITKIGTYSVFKTDENTGCEEEFKFIVRKLCEPRIFLPQAFTPNNDLTNDIFKPAVANLADYELIVFNRWGEVLFTSNDPEQGWDGKYKGEDSPTANYVYIVNYKGESLSGLEEYSKKGSFILMR